MSKYRTVLAGLQHVELKGPLRAAMLYYVVGQGDYLSGDESLLRHEFEAVVAPQWIVLHHWMVWTHYFTRAVNLELHQSAYSHVLHLLPLNVIVV